MARSVSPPDTDPRVQPGERSEVLAPISIEVVLYLLIIAIAAALRKQIKDYIGVSAVIDLREPGEVPRSEGKAVRVIDERK